MFASDRDLLVLAPTLFHEVSFLAQTLFRATARIQSGQLLVSSGSFPGSVHAGHVALVGEQPVEITSVVNSTTLNVSLLRPDALGPSIAPADAATLLTTIGTFEPQIELVHAQVLLMLGLEASRQSLDPRSPGESAVLNPRDLALVEALGALHLVYAAAAATLAPESALAARAADFQDRFARERWRVRALVDLDGDGRADSVRALSLTRLAR